jgi:hypothetical protein
MQGQCCLGNSPEECTGVRRLKGKTHLCPAWSTAPLPPPKGPKQSVAHPEHPLCIGPVLGTGRGSNLRHVVPGLKGSPL